MKIKNKLLSVFGILLFSCHPVTNPALASVIEYETGTFPVTTNEELSLCKDITAFAYVAMQAHQNGVSEEDQLALSPAPTNQDEAMLKVLLDGIVNDASIFPVYEDVADKVEVSERFSEVIYNICKGGG